MQTNFDDRCQRTKQIVTQLAQRLHEVKRDTYTELDRIQSRQARNDSAKTNSNSNSRSPAPTNVRQVVVQPFGPGEVSEKNTLGSYLMTAQPSQTSLVKSNYRGSNDQTTRAQSMGKHTRRNTSVSHNDPVTEISPIRADQTNPNDFSMVSTTTGLNFRQLKPAASEHNTSIATEVAENHNRFGLDQSQPPLCLETSPLRRAAKPNQPGRYDQVPSEEDSKTPAQERDGTSSNDAQKVTETNSKDQPGELLRTNYSCEKTHPSLQLT